jgi:hypothetical protein
MFSGEISRFIPPEHWIEINTLSSGSRDKIVFVSLVNIYPGLQAKQSNTPLSPFMPTHLSALTRTPVFAHSTARLEAMCLTAKLVVRSKEGPQATGIYQPLRHCKAFGTTAGCSADPEARLGNSQTWGILMI